MRAAVQGPRRAEAAGCRSPPAAPAASTRSTAAAWPRCSPRNGHTTTAETTSASVDNLFLVADGDSDVAFSLADTAIDAVEGKDSFDGEPLPLRALGTLYSNFTHVVALKSRGSRGSRT